MSLPAHRWSHLLQEFSQMFCVDQAFGQAAGNLGVVLKDRFSVDTIEKINQDLGASAGEFLADLPAPESGSEGKLLVASADGKGVPLIKRDTTKSAAYETAKKNPRTVGVLDILHALAYVWEAAGLFCPGEEERKAFTRARLLRILRGEVQGVIRGLRRMGTTRKLKGDPLKDLNRICGYLEKNSCRMRYDEYLRRGYPIASGVIEGACRHLVKDRMERSGMRWTLEGARSMLNLRAAFQSDYWRLFLDDHIAKETNRAHPNADLITDYIPLALAA